MASDQGTCDGFRSLNTTYNSDLNVPPYTGVFFEVAALNSLEILTLELDLVDYENLHVEVYSVVGDYKNLHQDSSAWELIANTTIVRAPEGTGAIIPLSEFNPVRLFARQKASLYVTLDVPKLDHSVFALAKTGDVHTRNADLQVMVGAGTHAYKFPETLDTTLHPMFAGVIHYETSQCNRTQVITNVQYSFLVDMEPEAFRDLLDDYFESQLNGNLKEFVNKFELQKPTIGTPVPVSYPYVCPETWKDCPRQYLQAEVSWMHNDELSSGLLQYELFRPSTLLELDTKFLHLGFSSTAAQFSINLWDTSASIHVKYFEDVTKHFLELTVPEKAFIWDVSVQQDVRRLGPSNSSVIRGVIRGAVPTATKAKEFRFAIDKAFRYNSDLYKKLLVDSARLRPGYDGAFEAFENLSGYGVSLSSYSDVSPATSGTNGANNLVIYVSGALGAVAFLVGLILLYRRKKQALERSRQQELCRQRRKEERRAKRKNGAIPSATKLEQAQKQRDDSVSDSSFRSLGGVVSEVALDRAKSGQAGSADVVLVGRQVKPRNCEKINYNTIGGYKIGNYSKIDVS